MSADDILVTPDWLHAQLSSSKVVAVEASFYLPDEGKDADALFRAGHIPGAVRFNVDTIADRSNPLPHMLPDAETFGQMAGALGLSEDNTLVVYDASDFLGGARAWWMLRHYGAGNVRLLDGGLAAWQTAGFPIETGEARRPPATFKAVFDARDVFDAERVREASETKVAQIVDARGTPRFEGRVPEPRPGLRSGHIPGAHNVPFRAMIGKEGRLKSPDAIAAAFQDAGVDVDKPIVTSCGSGVSAAVLVLGLERLGKTGIGLYDGSWSEWGGRADLPLETGPARL